MICVKDKWNITYYVCSIEYIPYEDETFEYRFKPYYDVIDYLDQDVFQGIPGLNLDLKKEVYIRNNIVPVFISERVPGPNREDLQELLAKVNLDYMEPIEYLCRTKEQYFGDHFFVIPFEERKDVPLADFAGKANSPEVYRLLLEELAKGNTIVFPEGAKAHDKMMFETLRYLCFLSDSKQIKQKEGIKETGRNGIHPGRKKIAVDEFLFRKTEEEVKKGLLSTKDAAKKLGISQSKYYQLRNEWKKQEGNA